MPYGSSTADGILRLLKAGFRWSIEFDGHRHNGWASPDDAVVAVVRHSTGCATWNRTRFVVSDDLLRWRPICDPLGSEGR